MASTATAGSAQEAGRAQPQTTIEPPGGPFIRHAQNGRRMSYTRSGDALGAVNTQPIPATPGYLKGFRIRVSATGGVGSSTAAVSALDQPYNIFNTVQLKDAFGTTIIQAPGFESLRLIQKYGGQFGLFACSDPTNLNSFSAVASTGNFTFASYLPFEFAKGYGVLSGANASLLPQLFLYGNPNPYTTAPGTAPTYSTVLEADFYWLPEGADVAPPGLGTTEQWVLAQGNPTVGSTGNVTVTLPRVGGYISTLIFELRDSTGVRIDPFSGVTNPTFQIRLDGVPVVDTRWETFQDDMQIQFSGALTSAWSRDTGVWAWTRKTSMNQMSLGLLDTGETLLSTNPGTAIEMQAPNWGTISNTPATLNIIAGTIVPTGAIQQGLSQV